MEFLKEAKNAVVVSNQTQYLDSEYARMGVPNNYWKLTDMNANYEICDTYVRFTYNFEIQIRKNHFFKGLKPFYIYSFFK